MAPKKHPTLSAPQSFIDWDSINRLPRRSSRGPGGKGGGKLVLILIVVVLILFFLGLLGAISSN